MSENMSTSEKTSETSDVAVVPWNERARTWVANYRNAPDEQWAEQYREQLREDPELLADVLSVLLNPTPAAVVRGPVATGRWSSDKPNASNEDSGRLWVPGTGDEPPPSGFGTDVQDVTGWARETADPDPRFWFGVARGPGKSRMAREKFERFVQGRERDQLLSETYGHAASVDYAGIELGIAAHLRDQVPDEVEGVDVWGVLSREYVGTRRQVKDACFGAIYRAGTTRTGADLLDHLRRCLDVNGFEKRKKTIPREAGRVLLYLRRETTRGRWDCSELNTARQGQLLYTWTYAGAERKFVIATDRIRSRAASGAAANWVQVVRRIAEEVDLSRPTPRVSWESANLHQWLNSESPHGAWDVEESTPGYATFRWHHHDAEKVFRTGPTDLVLQHAPHAQEWIDQVEEKFAHLWTEVEEPTDDGEPLPVEAERLLWELNQRTPLGEWTAQGEPNSVDSIAFRWQHEHGDRTYNCSLEQIKRKGSFILAGDLIRFFDDDIRRAYEATL